MSAINLTEKLALFDDLWSPRVVAALNDYQIKLAHVQGEFVWHCHDDTDELFMVIKGELNIEMPDSVISLKAGELFVVPRGVRHRPVSPSGADILLIEPSGVVNTGDSGGDLTAQTDVWV